MSEPLVTSGLSLTVGELVAGKYRLERLIGAGGMGKLFAAHDLTLDRQVAIKFLLGGSGEGLDRARFLREARAMARLSSEHVPRTYEVGQLPGGEPYLVIELLSGRDLSGELERRGGAVTPEQAAAWVIEACEGLAEAHALGMVHRDIKPQNLFLAERRDGTQVIKVLDFGISKAQSMLDPALTGTATPMGTPLYMAPEQFRSARDVEVTADVWSMGAVLYELVAGKPPFDADTLFGLYEAVHHGEPPALVARDGELPEGFERIIRQCLHKEPSKRYPDLLSLVADLATFAPRQEPAVARVARILQRDTVNAVAHASTRPAASLGFGVQSTAAIAVTNDVVRTRKGRWRVVAVPMIGLALAAVFGIGWMARRAVVVSNPSNAATSGSASNVVLPSALPTQVAAAASAIPSAASGDTVEQETKTPFESARSRSTAKRAPETIVHSKPTAASVESAPAPVPEPAATRPSVYGRRK